MTDSNVGPKSPIAARATPFGDVVPTDPQWPAGMPVAAGTAMREYRWFFHDRGARLVAADHGRFRTDDDAVSSAATLLSRHATAVAVEIWDGSRLIGRRDRVQP